MEIGKLRMGMRRVEVTGKIVDVSDERKVISRRTGRENRLAIAILADDTGMIELPLWNDNIDKVKKGDTVHIENGYVSSFRGRLQLNLGRYSKLTVMRE
ncbi:DNA-binding protein [archaeon]|nr:MAG: DNA-binding protein [archaeon]RLG64857.1 MAG: DNA-binding protein [archaeon]RLG65984.1 MAG: DNA-binding protein [archaeon]HDM23393.1 DNA-binding protein [Candidatus Bathyarchaeota archaeon]